MVLLEYLVEFFIYEDILFGFSDFEMEEIDSVFGSVK